MAIKKLSNLINSSANEGLSEIVERAQNMGELTQTLSKALPDELRGSLVAANLREDNELVLICTSSAWASRLRFEEASVMDAAKRHGINVDKVSVRVGRVDYNSDD